jgi:hypothetical protein
MENFRKWEILVLSQVQISMSSPEAIYGTGCGLEIK